MRIEYGYSAMLSEIRCWEVVKKSYLVSARTNMLKSGVSPLDL